MTGWIYRTLVVEEMSSSSSDEANEPFASSSSKGVVSSLVSVEQSAARSASDLHFGAVASLTALPFIRQTSLLPSETPAAATSLQWPAREWAGLGTLPVIPLLDIKSATFDPWL